MRKQKSYLNLLTNMKYCLTLQFRRLLAVFCCVFIFGGLLNAQNTFDEFMGVNMRMQDGELQQITNADNPDLLPPFSFFREYHPWENNALETSPGDEYFF